MSPADGPVGGITSRVHEHHATVRSQPPWLQHGAPPIALGILVASGVALRVLVMPLRPALAWAVLAVLTAAPIAVSAVRRLANRADPARLAREEREHRATLSGRVRWSTLDAVDAYLATVPLGRWASVHLCVPQPAGGQALVSVYPHGNRLLVMVHQNLMRDDPSFAVTCVARTLALARGWRLQLALAPRWLWYGGPVVVGWAVGWPWLAPALAAVLTVGMLTRWLAELAGDRYAITHHERKDVLEFLHQARYQPAGGPHPLACRCPECWGHRASMAAMTLTGLLPAPVSLRWALATKHPREAADGHA